MSMRSRASWDCGVRRISIVLRLVPASDPTSPFWAKSANAARGLLQT
jgi:hypothetical protein